MNSINNFRSQSELEEQLILKHYGLVVSQALGFIDNDKQLLEDYIQIGLKTIFDDLEKTSL